MMQVSGNDGSQVYKELCKQNPLQIRVDFHLFNGGHYIQAADKIFSSKHALVYSGSGMEVKYAKFTELHSN